MGRVLQLMGLTQGALAKAMGVQRKHVNELCNDRCNVTAATALIMGPVIRQQRRFLAQHAAAQRFVAAMNSPRERGRIRGPAAEIGWVSGRRH